MDVVAQSQNPLLKNLTDFLIEEANAEEEELLGISSGEYFVYFEYKRKYTEVCKRNILMLAFFFFANIHAQSYPNFAFAIIS